MYTIFAWLFVGAAGAFVACYSYGFSRIVEILQSKTPALVKNDGAEKRTSRKQKAKRKANVQGESKGQTTSNQALSNEGAASKKRKIASKPINGSVTAFTSQGQKATIPRDEDNSMSNKEFAMQLSQAQISAKLESTSKSGTNNKKERRTAKSAAKKQVGGQDAEPRETPTESSSTGLDADDEVTDVTNSPQLNGQSTAPTSGISDINDMLEAPAGGPKVIRLTNAGGASTTQKPKGATNPFEPVKTKKQTNAELKRQQQAADNARSAEEHRRKGEKQMREARVAEGTSAQTKSNSFRPNAWFGKKNDSEVQPQQNAAVQSTIQPLDTSDHEASRFSDGTGAATPQPVSDAANKHTIDNVNNENARQTAPSHHNGVRHEPSKQYTNGWAHEQSKLSEEDQIRKVMDEEDPWTTVSTKKERKKAKKDGDTSSEASTSTPRPVVQAKKSGSNGVNGSHAPSTSNRFKSMEISEPAEEVMQNDEWAA